MHCSGLGLPAHMHPQKDSCEAEQADDATWKMEKGTCCDALIYQTRNASHSGYSFKILPCSTDEKPNQQNAWYCTYRKEWALSILPFSSKPLRLCAERWINVA